MEHLSAGLRRRTQPSISMWPGSSPQSSSGWLEALTDTYEVLGVFPVAASATTVTASDEFPEGPNWSDIDQAFLMQYEPVSLGSFNKLVLGPELTLSNLTLNDTTNNITGTLAASPQASVSLNIPGTQWAAPLAGVGPSGAASQASYLSVTAEPYISGRSATPNLFGPDLPLVMPGQSLPPAPWIGLVPERQLPPTWHSPGPGNPGDRRHRFWHTAVWRPVPFRLDARRCVLPAGPCANHGDGREFSGSIRPAVGRSSAAGSLSRPPGAAGGSGAECDDQRRQPVHHGYSELDGGLLELDGAGRNTLLTAIWWYRFRCRRTATAFQWPPWVNSLRARLQPPCHHFRQATYISSKS